MQYPLFWWPTLHERDLFNIFYINLGGGGDAKYSLQVIQYFYIPCLCLLLLACELTVQGDGKN